MKTKLFTTLITITTLNSMQIYQASSIPTNIAMLPTSATIMQPYNTPPVQIKVIQPTVAYTGPNIMTIEHNNNIKKYVNLMAMFGYSDYFGKKLDTLTETAYQQNTALNYLNYYLTSEQNKYNNYMYHYNSLTASTAWYNYIFYKPTAAIYKLLANETSGDIENLHMIYNTIKN